jgi:tetratricopeptide (TPR) repeat protein
MPKRLAETPPGKSIPEQIGSGPFKFVQAEFQPGVKAVFEKNKDYVPRKEPPSWTSGGKVVKVDRVEWITMADAQTAVNALQSGDIDFLEVPSYDILPVLAADKNIVVETTNKLGFQTMGRMNFLWPPFDNVKVRRAALLALGQLGGIDANPIIAAHLKDDDTEARRLAADALWALWFRADDENNTEELQRLMRVRDREKAVAGLDRLLQKAPNFAEAYNQRAIHYFKMKQFERSIADCEKTLQLNPYHFGAMAGMAQSYMQMRKHKAALKAFRTALRINPNLDGVAETIRALENALGEEGRKDDKK